MARQNDGRGWHGDPDGHREAGKQAHENWLQTKWRHLREWCRGCLRGGGD